MTEHVTPLESTSDMIDRTAITDVGVCPDLVPVAEFGLHISRVKYSNRHWQFQTREARDNFVENVRAGLFRRDKKENG